LTPAGRVEVGLTYKYEVFLSYRRINEWPAFVEKTFLPMLKHWLQEELDGSLEIFYDADRLETGEAWPQALAEALATSKLMVCLWSRQYFSSDWCKAELSHMLARRKLTAKSDGQQPPLIIATVIHDGESIPHQLADIQRFNIQEYSNPWLGKGTKKEEELSDHIRRLARHAGHALTKVPEYDPAWPKLATDEFAALFAARHEQSKVPSLGVRVP
jgi:TIR domain-containing protein